MVLTSDWMFKFEAINELPLIYVCRFFQCVSIVRLAVGVIIEKIG